MLLTSIRTCKNRFYFKSQTCFSYWQCCPGAGYANTKLPRYVANGTTTSNFHFVPVLVRVYHKYHKTFNFSYLCHEFYTIV